MNRPFYFIVRCNPIVDCCNFQFIQSSVMRVTYLSLVFFIGLSIAVHGQVTFTSSNLPIVVINTYGQEIVDDPKIEADMGIIHNAPGVRNNLTDPFNNYSGKIGIEIRGSSSQSFPKKQYGIELVDVNGNGVEASLLGMPAEEDWVLFAPYNDKSLMRDVLAYRLARDQGRYAPRTKYCEVVLNGEYMGIYVLIEKIKRDKNRVDINKLEPDEITGNNLTGGYIIKIDKATGSGGDGWASTFPPPLRSGDQQVNFLYEAPKPEDIVIEQKQYIQQYMSGFEASLAGPDFADPVNGYAKYIDAASFIDYFIINEMSKNVDGYRISTFLHKKRDSDGGKIYMGPVWDYNLGFGNADYCTSGTTDGFVLEFNSICPGDWWLIPFWWDRLQDALVFREQLASRWVSLREGPYQTSTIHAYIDSVANVLNAESQQRNFTRWPVLGQYVWPNYYVGPTFQSEVDWLKEWMTDRLDWLDVHIPGLVTAANEKDVEFMSFSAYPNPFTSKFQIEYEIVSAGKVSISLLDVFGNIKVSSTLVHDIPGKFSYQVELPELVAGVYVVRAQANVRPALVRRVVKGESGH